MQESMIIDSQTSVDNLNRKLEDEWFIIKTCPMPSSCAVSVTGEFSNYRHIDHKPTCLVVIEK